MHYPDLSYYRVGFSEDSLQYVFPAVRCVGWLDAQLDYPQGSVPSTLSEKIREILFLDIHNAEAKRQGTFDKTQAIQVHQHYMRGYPQPCPFCKKTITVEPIGLEHYLGGSEKVLGRNQICLPSEAGLFFAAPTLIYHYITEHQYLPPQEFLTALEAFDLDKPFDINTARDRIPCLQVPTAQVNTLHLRPIPNGRYLSG